MKCSSRLKELFSKDSKYKNKHYTRKIEVCRLQRWNTKGKINNYLKACRRPTGES